MPHLHTQWGIVTCDDAAHPRVAAASAHSLTAPKETRMCYPVECPKCHKTTWGGCGMHVDQVMAAVPKDRQCTCPANQPSQTKKSGLFGIFG